MECIHLVKKGTWPKRLTTEPLAMSQSSTWPVASWARMCRRSSRLAQRTRGGTPGTSCTGCPCWASGHAKPAPPAHCEILQYFSAHFAGTLVVLWDLMVQRPIGPGPEPKQMIDRLTVLEMLHGSVKAIGPAFQGMELSTSHSLPVQSCCMHDLIGCGIRGAMLCLCVLLKSWR